MSELRPGSNVLTSRLPAVLLGTRVMDYVALPIQAGDEHRPPMLLATRLVRANNRRLVAFGSDVSQAFAEAAPAEFGGAAKEID